MIEVISVSKSYKDFLAVDDVSFNVEKGYVTGLLGPNGAGKSTILKAIAGIHYPSAGKIIVNGTDVEKNPVKVKKMIGFMSENPSFYENFSVSEYLNFIAEARGIQKDEIKSKIDFTVKQCFLEKVFKNKISTLSKGYRQRLAFAQAVIHNPSVLILDEPVSGLDPKQINEMRNLIKNLAQDKIILLSTHLMQEVNSICSKIIIFNEGKVVADGTASEITAKTGTKDIESAFLSLTSKEEK